MEVHSGGRRRQAGRALPFRKATRWVRLVIAALVFVPLLAGPALASSLSIVASQGGVPTLAPLLEKATPAVVNIAVRTRVPVEQNPLLRDPFFRRFFNLPDQMGEAPTRISAGSGVIVDAERGFVLTNHHVINNAVQVSVTLKDRRRFDATVVGSDPATDIAVLKIEGNNLVALPLGDSDALRVGDFVLAVGNPFGLGQTVTSGIVSALGRSGISPQGYEDFIQTDAPINPGNSGGALIDLNGRLVGVNTAIVAPAGGNVGIGFAVPSNMASRVLDQLVRHGEVKRGRLGVRVQDLTPDLAEALGLTQARGALVTDVEAGTVAQKAGIRPRDVIVGIDGHAVEDAASLRNKVGLTPVGKSVDVEIVRDGKRQTLKLRLAAG